MDAQRRRPVKADEAVIKLMILVFMTKELVIIMIMCPPVLSTMLINYD